MPKSPKEMIAAVVDNLPAKTGRNLEQWAELVRKEGPHEKKDIIAWLKTKHDIGTVTANFIAAEAIGQSVVGLYADEGALLDRMYAADRQPLRPLYDRLAGARRRPGADHGMTGSTTHPDPRPH